MLPGRHARCDGGLAKEVESEFGLWEEQVPEVARECGRQIGDDGKEVGFEGLDGSFGGIAAVDIRRDELVLCFPFVFDVCFEIFASLVVQDLEVHCEATFGVHDGVVGGKAMCIRSVSKRCT